jgi:hypothetical protein
MVAFHVSRLADALQDMRVVESRSLSGDAEAVSGRCAGSVVSQYMQIDFLLLERYEIRNAA